MQVQWENQNSYRKYPFEDNGGMTDADGYRLPDDVFTDGMLCPIAVVGRLYLSRMDIPGGLVELSDDTGVRAAAEAQEIGQAYDHGMLDFVDSRGRYFGTLLLGPGFATPGGAHVFTADQTPFAACCVTDVPASGVEGFLLPDGTFISGVITLKGTDGVRIRSFYSDGVPIVSFDSVGVGEPPDCFKLPPPCLCIDVAMESSAAATAALAISRSGNTIYLGHRSELADVCDNDNKLPDAAGTLPLDPGDVCSSSSSPACEDNEPWTPPGPCPDMADAGGRYFIVASGDLMDIRPVPTMDVAGPQLMDYITNSTLEPRSAQGLQIGLKGAPENVRTG